MNIQPSISPAYFPPPHTVNGANAVAHDHTIESEKKVEKEIEADSSTSNQAKSANTLEKSPEEEKIIQQLRKTDQEVRAHEMAHLAAAGGLSKGGATFEYQTGPDGQRYAVSGEVQIDTSGVSGDPEATLQKAQQIQRAAMAPAQPSAQDRSVAVAAAAMAAEARAEIASQTTGNEKNTENNPEESALQSVTSKINEAYTAITDIDSQKTATLINLTV
ncbi:MAG: putative metalloprotease CJM1_0395 family protein [Nitrosomonas sp.]|nr:putative metalloprotease CJM1_0395 family protein [Nitrosomonas sp.]